MTRDELEATIWRNWPARGSGVTEAIDAILKAADAYAITEGGLTAERRAVLARATASQP
jgi:hypothetical protein